MALYIVATPIGNLKDITARGLEILSSVEYILCETPLLSKKLLNHYKIETPVKNYREDSHEKVYPQIIADLKLGKNIALITDAGTPVVSDPGIKLLREVYKENLSVLPVPGVSAVTTAISVFPVPSPKLIFVGFFPRKMGDAKKLIEGSLFLMTKEKTSMVFFESPMRIIKTLEMLRVIDDTLVKQNNYSTHVGISQEATKMYETYMWLPLVKLLQDTDLQKKLARGELTIVLSLLKNEKYDT